MRKKGLRTYADSIASDKTVHHRCLIRELHCSLFCKIGSNLSAIKQDCADAETDLELHCRHDSEDHCSRDASYIP